MAPSLWDFFLCLFYHHQANDRSKYNSTLLLNKLNNVLIFHVCSTNVKIKKNDVPEMVFVLTALACLIKSLI